MELPIVKENETENKKICPLFRIGTAHEGVWNMLCYREKCQWWWKCREPVTTLRELKEKAEGVDKL